MHVKRTVSRAAPILLLVLAASCTSAVAPGGQDVLDQADKAKEVQVELALRNTATAEAQYSAEMGTFTGSVQELQNRYGLNLPEGVTITIPTADTTSYCIQANHADLGDYHLTNTDPTMSKGTC